MKKDLYDRIVNVAVALAVHAERAPLQAVQESITIFRAQVLRVAEAPVKAALQMQMVAEVGQRRGKS